MDHNSSARPYADNGHPVTSGRYPSAARLTLRETPAGVWIVRDAEDRRGGCFVSCAAAMKYIRTEFGRDARIVTIRLPRKEAA